MDKIDIICMILDELDDARSILNCKYINRLWYSVITRYKKYLYNPDIFVYLIENKPIYSRMISDDILRIFSLLKFHETIPIIGIREMLLYVPNNKCNFLEITLEYKLIVDEVVNEWIYKYFIKKEDFEQVVEKVTRNKDIKTRTLYKKYYDKSDIINKIIWIFILINSKDIEEHFHNVDDSSASF